MASPLPNRQARRELPGSPAAVGPSEEDHAVPDDADTPRGRRFLGTGRLASATTCSLSPPRCPCRTSRSIRRAHRCERVLQAWPAYRRLGIRPGVNHRPHPTTGEANVPSACLPEPSAGTGRAPSLRGGVLPSRPAIHGEITTQSRPPAADDGRGAAAGPAISPACRRGVRAARPRPRPRRSARRTRQTCRPIAGGRGRTGPGRTACTSACERNRSRDCWRYRRAQADDGWNGQSATAQGGHKGVEERSRGSQPADDLANAGAARTPGSPPTISSE